MRKSREEVVLADSLHMIRCYLQNRGGYTRMQGHISKLVHFLYHEYGIRRDDLRGTLSQQFIARRRHEKYDPERAPLEKFVAYFTYYGLKSIVCECNRYRDQNRMYPLARLSQGEKWNSLGRPIEPYEDQGIEDLIDPDSPEDLYIGKELYELAEEFFGKQDLSVLLGIMDRDEVARELGLSYDAYKKQLQRRRNEFRSFIKRYGYLDD
jgi:hypothetical protein